MLSGSNRIIKRLVWTGAGEKILDFVLGKDQDGSDLTYPVFKSSTQINPDGSYPNGISGEVVNVKVIQDFKYMYIHATSSDVAVCLTRGIVNNGVVKDDVYIVPANGSVEEDLAELDFKINYISLYMAAAGSVDIVLCS